MHRQATAALAALAAVSLSSGAQAVPLFSHIIVVFQENRTPDNIFGSNPTFEPGVDIATSGQDSRGNTIALKAEPINSCYDLGHSHMSFTLAYRGGKMDGADLNTASFIGSCVAPLNPAFKFADNSTGDI